MHKNLLLVVFFVFSFIFIPNISQAATLTLSPSSASVSVNGTFTVNILLNTTGQATYGVDVNRLRFNPSILQVVDSDAGTSGVQVVMGGLMSVTTINSVDNTGGSIQLSQLAEPGNTYNGSGTFATITFRGVSAGTANVNFDFTSGSGVDTNVAGLGSDLLSSVTNGTYTVTASDTTPPSLSGGSPTGTLPYTTTSATASITTNEASTCRMSSTANQLYTSGSMVTMTTTGGTTHSNSISGLSSGNTYTRYFRCSDVAGNQNTTDYVLTFSVASTPDSTAPVISSIGSSAITTSGATIAWTTNEASDTQVEYGSTVSYGQSSVLNSSLVLSHTASLSGLSSNSTYHYRVKSRDASGNLATSADQVFITAVPAVIQRRMILVLEGAGISSRNVTGIIQYINPTTFALIGQSSITTDTSGQVTVTLPSGLPSIFTAKPVILGYLSRNTTGVDSTSASILTVTTTTLLAGDFNGDQIINSLDFSSMNSNWLTSNSLTDINKDGTVNSLDFAFVSNNWLEIGQ